MVENQLSTILYGKSNGKSQREKIYILQKTKALQLWFFVAKNRLGGKDSDKFRKGMKGRVLVPDSACNI